MTESDDIQITHGHEGGPIFPKCETPIPNPELASKATQAIEAALELSKALDELALSVLVESQAEAKVILAKVDEALGNLELWAMGNVLPHTLESQEP